MPFTLAALAFGAHALVAVADKVPEFDTRPSCRAGADSGLSTRPDVDACVKNESQARDDLARQWGEFASADRIRCVETTRMGGPPSYVEVLTCLEMARDAKRLPTNENTGLDGAKRRR